MIPPAAADLRRFLQQYDDAFNFSYCATQGTVQLSQEGWVVAFSLLQMECMCIKNIS